MGEQLELFPDVLTEARGLIRGQRNEDYGPPHHSLGDIAKLWSVFLNRRPPGDLTASDVCMLMALLKMARLSHQPGHKDSIIDAAGYLGLAEMCQ